MLVAATVASSSATLVVEVPICDSGPRVNCVVDGDTVWVDRVKYRLEGINAPEKGALAQCTLKYLDDNPGRLHDHFAYLAVNALRETWPCPD
jgi:endonuclease YncB( thermonuclease family)